MVSRLAYRDQSRAYLEQANEELAKEDIRPGIGEGLGSRVADRQSCGRRTRLGASGSLVLAQRGFQVG